MNIVSKTLMVTTSDKVVLENHSISLTVLQQIYISTHNGWVNVDIELLDYEDVLFLGKPVQFRDLNTMLKNLGIELNDLILNETINLITEEDKQYLKNLYLKTYDI